MKKFNQSGFTHWVAPVLIAAIGTYVMKNSHADAQPVAEAYHWGGYFGDPNKSTTLYKVVVPTGINLPAPVVQVATSNSDEYALLNDGTVYAWGLGDYGELGNGTTKDSPTTAVQVQFPAGVKIASLPTDAMPYDTALAVDTNGNSWGWGDNSYGQLCLGNTNVQTTPVQLPLSSITTLAGAGDHAVYDSSGTVYACGANLSGDLGDNSSAPSYTPVAVVGLPSVSVTNVVAAYEDAGVLLSNGQYFDWGLNSGGQVGDGNRTNSSVPVQVNLPLAVTQVAQGGSDPEDGQTIVMLSDGTLRAWGNDQWGQLGDGGAKKLQASPVQISPPNGVTYQTLASGGGTSYAISTTGNVYAWGEGSKGQLGLGPKVKKTATPTLVESGMSLISATAANVNTAH
jgi:alpha-tubulin suppressor-like RCC1 family protein